VAFPKVSYPKLAVEFIEVYMLDSDTTPCAGTTQNLLKNAN
jgi:hypothetical protein